MFGPIAAPITALGGAVAVIRVDGADSWSLSRSVLASKVEASPRRSIYAKFVNGDDGLVTFFQKGSSFTGNEGFECAVHGSPASVRHLLELLYREGCAPARPGEFSERAFLNGRIDLTQAEAIDETVRAITDRQLRLANENRDGALRLRIEKALDPLQTVIATLEAHVDFSEELGDPDPDDLIAKLQDSLQELRTLAEAEHYGRLIRNGIRTALLGRPNAGKSSLFNALLGSNRAIVTDIEGTTRDYLEDHFEIDGLLFTLIDTAGLRNSSDVVEEEGIRRTRTQAESADLILYLFDGSKGWTDEDESEYERLSALNASLLRVATKADLQTMREELSISTLTGDGFPELRKRLVSLVPETEPGTPNARHKVELESASESIEAAVASIRHALPMDLAVTHLRSAEFSLGAIIGLSPSGDVLDRIFSKFCIGK